MDKFDNITVFEYEKLVDALRKIDSNTQGFVIIVDDSWIVKGVLTDGDIRRAFIRGCDAVQSVLTVCTREAKIVKESDGFEMVTELFKNQAIKFLPIVDEQGRLSNIITKNQMHALLLQDIHADLTYDFFSLDTSIVDYEIFQRPWGYYKTTVLNDYFQGKIISVSPGGGN